MNRKQEIEAVKKLGEKIGYGHLMSVASALWRQKLKETGVPTSVAFVPTIIDFIKKVYKDNTIESISSYDELISIQSIREETLNDLGITTNENNINNKTR